MNEKVLVLLIIGACTATFCVVMYRLFQSTARVPDDPEELAARGGWDVPTGDAEAAPKTVKQQTPKGFPLTRREWKAAELGELMTRDPGFKTDEFLKRAKAVANRVHEFNIKSQSRQLRPIVTDGMLERISIQRLMEKQRLREVTIFECQVVRSKITFVHCNPHFDQIDVEMTTTVKQRIDRHERSTLVHGIAIATSEATWSFLRRPGVLTDPKKGTVQGTCPRCGAPLAISDRGACDHCGAYVNNGEFDWVLAEITDKRHIKDWVEEVQGLRDLLERDPAFSPQAIEDRASLMFWRLRAAEMLGDARPIKGIASPSFIAPLRDDFSPAADRGVIFHADLDVGSACLVAIDQLASPHRPLDRAHVRIRWSSRAVRTVLPALVVVDHHEPRFRDQVMVLERAATSMTHSGSDFLSRACLGCGAPETRLGGDSCERCGKKMTGVEGDWLLSDVYEYVGVGIGEGAD